jgi:hypothetical protein
MAYGAGAEKLLKNDDCDLAKHIAYGIAEVSQTARNFVISFAKQYAEFEVCHEEGWSP